MKYKVGDTVRILTSDYPSSIAVGTIATISKISNTVLYINGGMFWEREVEPYQETQSIKETMNYNTQGFEVGDVVNHVATGSKELTIMKIDDTRRDGAKDSDGDWCSFTSLTLVRKGAKKELLGYSIKSEYQDQVGFIAKALDTHTGTVNNGAYWMPVGGVSDNAKKLGVLDLWFEPVYKADEVVVKLSGNRTITIINKLTANINLSGYIGPIQAADIAYTLDALNKLGQIGGYNVAVKQISLGCQTFTIDDLVAVDKAFKEFKG